VLGSPPREWIVFLAARAVCIRTIVFLVILVAGLFRALFLTLVPPLRSRPWWVGGCWVGTGPRSARSGALVLAPGLIVLRV